MSFPSITLVFLTFLLLPLNNRAASDEVHQDNGTRPTTAEQRVDSWEQHQQLKRESPWKDLSWESVGPRMQGGRIESIAVSPRNKSVIYAGVGSGGLWKSENNGLTWTPIFQQQSTCAIGDIAISRKNPDVIWVGTGEVLMARSALTGMGMYKSEDGGQTWENKGLVDSHHIARVLIDPRDDDVVYVAAIGHRSSPNQQRGVFKTIDGGKTWNKVLFGGEETAAIDLAFQPDNPSVLYASMWDRSDSDRKDKLDRDQAAAGSAVYKSTDSGESWRRLAGGLPTGENVGRIGIDVAPSNPNVVYAIVDEGKQDKLYRSDDAGKNWEVVNDELKMIRWDWCEVHVSPEDENEIYNIGQRSYRSVDGGHTFEQINGTIIHLLSHGSDILHLDTHAMWINPDDPNHIFFGNDGGLFVTFDRCKTWLHLNTLPIAECYAVTYDMDEPYNIYIGTQDNAALFGPSTHRPQDGEPDAWQHVYLDRWGGGDSYFTYRDPTDPHTIYYEHQFGELRRKNMETGETVRIKPSLDAGNSEKDDGTTEKDEGNGVEEDDGGSDLRFAWMTPYFPSPHDGHTLYYGANRVFKSTDRGDHWTCISPDLAAATPPPNTRYRAITTMDESPLQQGLIYAGTDTGQLFRTDDDGGTWIDIGKDLPRHRYTRVFASPHDPDVVFAAQSNKSVDDFRPWLFRSEDRGKPGARFPRDCRLNRSRW